MTPSPIPNEHERFAIPDDLAPVDDALREMARADADAASERLARRARDAGMAALRAEPAQVEPLVVETRPLWRRLAPMASAAGVALALGAVLWTTLLRSPSRDDAHFGYTEIGLLLEVDDFFSLAMNPTIDALEWEDIAILELEIAALEAEPLTL
ncbi:MAG: hypothetical protein EA379_11250 [Phycisphaerales bacterium]|nr:MAG: hypothetical protein EA379_11250 [Phycisphaerales bacterium]